MADSQRRAVTEQIENLVGGLGLHKEQSLVFRHAPRLQARAPSSVHPFGKRKSSVLI